MQFSFGEVQERLNWTVSKTVVPLRAPWVRIPPSPPFTFLDFSKAISGEVSERFKEHAWKVCVRQNRTEGSNPSLSAIFDQRDLFCRSL